MVDIMLLMHLPYYIQMKCKMIIYNLQIMANRPTSDDSHDEPRALPVSPPVL